MKRLMVLTGALAIGCFLQVDTSCGGEPSWLEESGGGFVGTSNGKAESAGSVSIIAQDQDADPGGPLAAGDGGGEFLYGMGRDKLHLVYVNSSQQLAKSADLLDTPWRAWGGASNSDSAAYFWATEIGVFSTGEGSALYQVLPAEGAVAKIGSGYGQDPADPCFFAQIQEIGYDEDSGILYGTNYLNLYSIDPMAGTLGYVGEFGAGFDGEPIERIWGMDYDPDIGEMVIIDQKVDPDNAARISSQMYYVDTATVETSYVGDTQENGLTDLYYSQLSNRPYACGNGPNRFFDADTTSGLVVQMAEIGDNLLGVSGSFAESEGVDVSISGSCTATLCVHSELNSDRVEDCDTAFGTSFAEASDGAFVQEGGELPGVGQDSSLVGNVGRQNELGHGLLNSQFDFNTLYNGTNQHGQGGGRAVVNMTGSLQVGTSVGYPNGSRGLLLIVDGERLLNEDVSQHSADWYLNIYDSDNPDRPLIVLTDEDLPEQNNAPFMGAAYVLAGERLEVGFHAEVEISRLKGDVNGDGIVNLEDFAVMFSWWLSEDCSGANTWCDLWDTEPDGDVDFQDFLVLLNDWLAGELVNNESSLQLDYNFEFRTVEAPLYSGVYNDDCQNAIGVIPDHRYLGTTVGASGTDMTSCGYHDACDVWYEFTPDRNGVYGLEVEGRGFNPYIAIFDSCVGNQLHCWSVWDDAVFQANAWTPYLIRIAGSSYSSGNFNLTVNYYPEPDNDDCQDASEISSGQYQFSNHGATGSAQSSCGSSDTRDVWYSCTPDYDSTAVITAYSWNESKDVTVVLYGDCEGMELACDRSEYCDTGPPLANVAYDVSAGETYYIRVAFDNNEMGKFDLSLDFYDPPMNDECSEATEVEADQWYDESTYGATGEMESNCGFGDTKDVWYSYTPYDDGAAVFRVSTYECGPDYTVSLYESCEGGEEACQQAESGYMGDVSAELAYSVESGQTYYIRVAFNDDSVGRFELEVSHYPPPPNDECADAIEIMGLDQWDEGSTYGASGNETTLCCMDNRIDVWYSYTADSSQTLYFSVENYDEGPGGDEGPPMTIALYDACDGEELECDCGSCDMGSEVEYAVTQDETYWIRIAREDNAVGGYSVSVSDYPYCDGPM